MECGGKRSATPLFRAVATLAAFWAFGATAASRCACRRIPKTYRLLLNCLGLLQQAGGLGARDLADENVAPADLASVGLQLNRAFGEKWFAAVPVVLHY